jgi:hypothetical protein
VVLRGRVGCVIPTHAGIQEVFQPMDPGLRRDDGLMGVRWGRDGRGFYALWVKAAPTGGEIEKGDGG